MCKEICVFVEAEYCWIAVCIIRSDIFMPNTFDYAFIRKNIAACSLFWCVSIIYHEDGLNTCVSCSEPTIITQQLTCYTPPDRLLEYFCMASYISKEC